jgi:hypothetical protein
MAIWTDVIEPETLTEYARNLTELEEGRGDSLAQFMPNNQVDDIRVTVAMNQKQQVTAAKFRAFDAETSMAQMSGGKEATFRLAPVGQQMQISESDQTRFINKSNDEVKSKIYDVTDVLVRNTVAAVELLRAQVLVSGRLTIPEVGVDDDFGRNPLHDVTAAHSWADPSVSRLNDFYTWTDVYSNTNGEAPGCIYMTKRVFRAMVSGDEFKTVLIGGANRPATVAEALALLESHGLPPIILCERKVDSKLIIPTDRLLLLPSPVGTSDHTGTQLGATFWGQTLSSTQGGFSLGNQDLPGLVAYAATLDDNSFRKNVQVDAIASPVMVNPDLSFVATVL